MNTETASIDVAASTDRCYAIAPKIGELLDYEGGIYAGIVEGVKVDGEPKRYKIVNQDDLQQRFDGTAASRSKRRTKPSEPAPGPSDPRMAKKQKKRRATKRVQRQATETVRTFSYFLDEDSDLQIARRDGIGDAAIVPKAEALQLLAFLDRHRAALEAA